MAVEKKDIEDVAEALGKKFDEFKKTNDKRIDGLEEEKGKLSGQVDTLNEKLGELDALKSSLEKELIAIKRPDGTGTKAASEHKAAFLQFVRKGIDTGLGELQAKALQIGVESDGGYAVPEDLDRSIIELLRETSPMRQVAQADAQNRLLAGEVLEHCHRNARLCRRFRAGRDADAVRVQRFDLFERDFIIAVDPHVFAQLAEILHDVVGEGVVVVDH